MLDEHHAHPVPGESLRLPKARKDSVLAVNTRESTAAVQMDIDAAGCRLKVADGAGAMGGGDSGSKSEGRADGLYSAPKRRMHFIDALRGLAMLGIVIVNLAEINTVVGTAATRLGGADEGLDFWVGRAIS